MADTVIVANSPTVLQVTSGGVMALNVAITDAGDYYASNNVEGALQEVGQSLNQDVNELEPVISQRTAPPISPATADRYLIDVGGTGAWAGQDNSTAEWNGSSWDFTAPVLDDVVYITSTLSTLRYDGSAWVRFAGVAVLQNGNAVGLAGLTVGSTTPREFKLITNDIERARILSSGEVGIGTETPAYLFDVDGTSSSKQYESAYQTLAYSATVAWDMASGQASKLTLTGDALISNPTNKESITPILEVTQDGVGAHTLTFDTDFAEVDVSQVTTDANSITVYAFVKGSDGNFRGQGKTFTV